MRAADRMFQRDSPFNRSTSAATTILHSPLRFAASDRLTVDGLQLDTQAQSVEVPLRIADYGASSRSRSLHARPLEEPPSLTQQASQTGSTVLTTDSDSSTAVYVDPVTDGSKAEMPYQQSQKQQVQTPEGTGGPWQAGGWCDSNLGKQFTEAVSMCGAPGTRERTDALGTEAGPYSVQCFRSRATKHMGRCALEHVALHTNNSQPHPMITQLEEGAASCPNPTLQGLNQTVDIGDPTRAALTEMFKQNPLPGSSCTSFEQRTAFLFVGIPQHIYFRMIEYHNVVKAIQNEGLSPDQYVVLRLSEDPEIEYRFPEWERQLFPGLTVVGPGFPGGELPCFRRLVLVPWAFSSMLFRCKMSPNLIPACFACGPPPAASLGHETEHVSTGMAQFRQQVLDSCSLRDEPCGPSRQEGKLVVSVISRQPYQRCGHIMHDEVD